jgi:cell division protein FtsL
MANYRYNRYQYETSPRKLEPEYEPIKNPYSKKKSTTIKKKQEKVQPKKHLKTQIKTVIYIGLIFASFVVISYRNSLINESFNENEKLKSNLAAVQKENEQLKVNLENSLNLSNIEKMAEKKLGMQKLDNSQKVYVSLDKEDYVEPASEEVIMEEEKNWFEQLLDNILGK